MKAEELELFRQMLEMVGSAGETSVWLIIIWWGLGLLKGITVLGFIGWLAYYIISTLVSANREIDTLREWLDIVKGSKETPTYTYTPEATRFIDTLIKKECLK